MQYSIICWSRKHFGGGGRGILEFWVHSIYPRQEREWSTWEIWICVFRLFAWEVIAMDYLDSLCKLHMALNENIVAESQNGWGWRYLWRSLISLLLRAESPQAGYPGLWVSIPGDVHNPTGQPASSDAWPPLIIKTFSYRMKSIWSFQVVCYISICVHCFFSCHLMPQGRV